MAAAPGFFARFFEALDGGDPHSALDLLSDDLEFAILFAAGDDGRSRQFRGGVDELREFTDLGDMEGWGHVILQAARVEDAELVIGETRTEQGQVLGTFVCAGRLDGDGKMSRYLVGRSAAIRFSDPH